MKKTKGKSLGLNELTFREDPRPTGVRRVRDIVQSSGFFSKDETDVAMELVEERLLKGVTSRYYFSCSPRKGMLFSGMPEKGECI
jgi:hypothetical protein